MTLLLLALLAAAADPAVSPTEVSIAEFEAFAASGAYTTRALWSDAGWAWAQAHPNGAGATTRAQGRPPNHPVVAVTYYEAEAYCRSQGQSLPSDATWQRAACGTGRLYPWGNREDHGAVFYDGGKSGKVATVATQAVDTGPVVDGLHHAGGNVWEWTSTTWTADQPWRVIRGGSYMNLASYCLCAHRDLADPEDVRLTVGFRCTSSP